MNLCGKKTVQKAEKDAPRQAEKDAARQPDERRRASKSSARRYHAESKTHLSVIPQDLAPYFRRLPDFTGPVPQSLLISDTLLTFMDYNPFDRICQALSDLLQRAAAVESVLDAILNLSALCVVEAIDGA